MKMFGIGLTLAVLVDAFLIRLHAGPRVHGPRRQRQLVGSGPLRRFHDRFGICEHVDLDDELTVVRRR